MSEFFDSFSAHTIVVPKTEVAWSQIPDVEDGPTSFRALSEEARFVQGLLESGKITFDVKPVYIRNLYPFLHKYKKTSFCAWYYKVRGLVRATDTFQAPSASALSIQARAQTKLTAALAYMTTESTVD